MTWCMTSFAAGGAYVEELNYMEKSFRTHHPGVPIFIGFLPSDAPWQELSNRKVKWLQYVRRAFPHYGDLLWLDADARVRRPIELPSGIDIGGQIYKGDTGRIATGTMWIANTDAATAVLDAWADEVTPGESNEISLLRVLKRVPHVYGELPRSMTSPCSMTKHGYKGKLLCDPAIVHWNRSRKSLGVKGWPPPEEQRV